MPFLPDRKTFLFALFPLVMPVAAAADAVVHYRFGEWTLRAPASLSPQRLAGSNILVNEGIEITAHWQQGKDRAVALRFDSAETKKDAVVLKSFRNTRRVQGCKFTRGSHIEPLALGMADDIEKPEWPDGSALTLPGADRTVRRVGDMLVFDLGGMRVQLNADEPVVRVGEWGTADFCRFELRPDVETEDE